MRAAVGMAVLLSASGYSAVQDHWLVRVEPVMTSQERQRYLSLPSEDEKEAFRTAFWKDKTITADQYFERISWVDAKYGSAKEGSGANTDQGRIYLSLGPPTEVIQLPSSRLLIPLEIWRYDHVPGLAVSSEIQLLFFEARGVGFMKLYSPQLHTFRALLINNAGTRGAFGVNDAVNEQDLLNRVKLSPAELQAVDAAMGVARGIRGSGNSELLYRVSSPAQMIRRNLRETVQSRVFAAASRPQLTGITQYRSADRISVVELHFQTSVQSKIGLEIPGLESVETRLNFAQPSTVTYYHRLYLLPGSWTVTLHSDGQRTLFPFHVQPLSDTDPEAPADLLADAEASGIQIAYRANLSSEAPWTSVGRQYLRNGDYAKAGFCFGKALQTGRRTPDALAGYGRYLALINKLDESRTYLLEALAAQPDHYQALVALAGVTARFQDYDTALGYYRQAQAIHGSGDIEAAIRDLTTKLTTASPVASR